MSLDIFYQSLSYGGVMEAKDLFVIENEGLIFGQDGVYNGHVLLGDIYNNNFGMFLNYIDFLEETELRETLRKFFMEGFNRGYFEAQQSLANKFLRGKIVSVSGGIVTGDINPNEMYVYWTGCPDWFEIEKNPGTILVLSYNDDCVRRILINMETTIKVIGKI
ncbi:MAG: hypothetical protein PHX25_00235 [Candidatus Pacebacteria bacterium]|nr:hypothetical protein [Candidatus Paceibacterota bacterium]